MREPQTEFGRELRKLRREGEVRYSQAQLANLAGVTASYISQLEIGTKIPTARVIRQLSPHLGVTSNHLLSKIGMVEMDLASTLATHRDRVRVVLPTLPDQEKEELANYLTYLEFKASVLG